MLLKDVLKEFLFDCEIRKMSSRTIKSYRNNNKRVFNFIEGEFEVTELEEVSHLHIKQYLKFLISKGLTELYVNSILKCLRAFFVYSVREDYLLKSPCLKVSWQREPKTIIKTFTDDEVCNMVKAFNYSDYLNARNKCIIAFLVDTGIRNNETCQLKTVDIKENFISIFGKGKRERVVPISPILKKVMMKYERFKECYFLVRLNDKYLYLLAKAGYYFVIESIVYKRIYRNSI